MVFKDNLQLDALKLLTNLLYTEGTDELNIINRSLYYYRDDHQYREQLACQCHQVYDM